MKTYLEATEELGKEFYQRFNKKGKVIMLNLLRFRKVANYTHLENIKPERELSGKEAYDVYMKCTLPFLERTGGSIRFLGESKSFLIGPEIEKWDAVLLVQHKSVADFMAFAQNDEYLKIAGHRTAALEDSRLLPISESY